MRVIHNLWGVIGMTIPIGSNLEFRLVGTLAPDAEVYRAEKKFLYVVW